MAEAPAPLRATGLASEYAARTKYTIKEAAELCACSDGTIKTAIRYPECLARIPEVAHQ